MIVKQNLQTRFVFISIQKKEKKKKSLKQKSIKNDLKNCKEQNDRMSNVKSEEMKTDGKTVFHKIRIKCINANSYNENILHWLKLTWIWRWIRWAMRKRLQHCPLCGASQTADVSDLA